MARLLTEGFELQSLTAGLGVTTKTGSPTINTTTFRGGVAAMRCNPTAATSFIGINHTTSNNLIYVRFAVYIATLPAGTIIIARTDETAYDFLGAIKLTSTGTLQLWSITTVGPSTAVQIGADSAALSTGAWHVVTFFMNTTTASSWPCTAAVDGTTFVNTTLTSVNDSNFGINKLWIGAINTATCDLYFDDIALNDSSGTSQTGLPDWNAKVIRMLPDSAGDANTFATQTGGTAGATNNFTRVDEITPDDATSFNGSNTLNQTDMLNVAASGIGASDTVNVVHVGARFANNVADAATAIKFQIEKAASGTKALSSAIIPNSVTWKTNSTSQVGIHPITLYKDPDGVNAWTQTTLDSMQIGYIISTGGTNAIDVTDIWADVDYTPAAVTSTIGPGWKTLLGVGRI
jgi:hypothetical protein